MGHKGADEQGGYHEDARAEPASERKGARAGTGGEGGSGRPHAAAWDAFGGGRPCHAAGGARGLQLPPSLPVGRISVERAADVGDSVELGAPGRPLRSDEAGMGSSIETDSCACVVSR